MSSPTGVAPVRVGFVGAGQRVREMYVPVIRALGPLVVPAGVTSTTAAGRTALAKECRIPAYDDIAKLAADVDLLIVAVHHAATASVAIEAIATQRAVLVETPLAVKLADAREIVRRAASTSAPVGVAEQKPYLPWECFRRELLATDILGQIVVVENDYRSLEYHAIAQLRRQLPSTARPVAVQAIRVDTPIAPTAPQSSSYASNREIWTIGTIAMEGGVTLIHRSTSAYGRVPFRTFRSLRTYGTRGIIVNEDVAVLRDDGKVVQLVIEKTAASGSQTASRIRTDLPDGREVTWDSPLPDRGLSDDQLALATHLISMAGAIRSGTPVLYSAHDALIDLELLGALSRSARKGGMPVTATHRCGVPGCSLSRRWSEARHHLEAFGRRVAGSDFASRVAAATRTYLKS